MHSHSGLGDSFVVRPSSVSDPFISCWFYFSYTLSKISNPSAYNPYPMIAPFPYKLSSSRPLSLCFPPLPLPMHTHVVTCRRELLWLLSSNLVYCITAFPFGFVPGAKSYLFPPRKSCHWDGKICFLARCHQRVPRLENNQMLSLVMAMSTLKPH